MSAFSVRFTARAEADLERLFDFLAGQDLAAAERALIQIREGIRVLESTPFSCRKALPGRPLLRELVIPFGAAGYVALFEIDGPDQVTVLAVRHQREDDLW